MLHLLHFVQQLLEQSRVDGAGVRVQLLLLLLSEARFMHHVLMTLLLLQLKLPLRSAKAYSVGRRGRAYHVTSAPCASIERASHTSPPHIFRVYRSSRTPIVRVYHNRRSVERRSHAATFSDHKVCFASKSCIVLRFCRAGTSRVPAAVAGRARALTTRGYERVRGLEF
jgi:hypothetical protein